MHDFPIGNGADFIERLAVCITMHRANIDSFVKAGIDGAACGVDGVADKAVFPALPRRRFFSLVIAFDVLVKSRTIAREQSVIIRWQIKIEGDRFRVRRHVAAFKSADISTHSKHRKHANRRKEPAHRFFFWPECQSFFIKSMSAVVSPEGM